MKKKTKIWLGIILAIILIGIVGAGGKMYLEKREEEKKEALIEIVKEHKDLIREELSQDDKHNRIQTISINYNSVKLNPMGGIMFTGIVNNNKKFYITGALIEKNSGEYMSAGTGISSDLEDYLEK